MSGSYLEKLEHLSMLHKHRADLSQYMETLQQDLTDITQKPSSFFGSLTPVEFLSMIHYQTAIMSLLNNKPLGEVLTVELMTLVPFLSIARFYFENEQQIPVWDQGRRFVTAWDRLAKVYEPTLKYYDREITFPELESDWNEETWADSLFQYAQEVFPQAAAQSASLSIYLLLSALKAYLTCLNGETIEVNHRLDLHLSAAGILIQLIQHHSTSEEEKNAFAQAVIKLLDSNQQGALAITLTCNEMTAIPDSPWLFLEQAGGIKDKTIDFQSKRYQTFDLLARAQFQLEQYEACKVTVKNADTIFQAQSGSVINQHYFSEFFGKEQRELIELRKTCCKAIRETASDDQAASHVRVVKPSKTALEERKATRRAKKPYKHQQTQASANEETLEILSDEPKRNRRFARPIPLDLTAPALCFSFDGSAPRLLNAEHISDHRLKTRLCKQYATAIDHRDAEQASSLKLFQ